MLTRESILAAADLVADSKEVPVPEWGGTIRVRVMSGTERDLYEKSLATNKDEVITRLLSLTICDDQGALLFSPSDVAQLNDKSAKVLVRVFDAAISLNKLRTADTDEAEKN